jgi:hypothetical protein
MFNLTELAAPQSDICLVFRNAHRKLANIKKKAFQFSGLHPFKPDVLSDENLLPSEVSNQPEGQWNEEPAGENDKGITCAFVHREKKEAEDKTSADDLKINRHPRAMNRRRKNKNFFFKHISRGAGQLGDQR